MSQDFPWTFLQNDKNNVKIIPIPSHQKIQAHYMVTIIRKITVNFKWEETLEYFTLLRIC